jgi:hypothetical protein
MHEEFIHLQPGRVTCNNCTHTKSFFNEKWYSPLQVDNKKRTSDLMFLRVYLGGDFLWRRKDKLCEAGV